jgi:hypothetical protein
MEDRGFLQFEGNPPSMRYRLAGGIARATIVATFSEVSPNPGISEIP